MIAHQDMVQRGNFDFQRQLARELTANATVEEAIQFCMEMGWQETVARILETRSHLVGA